MTPLGIKWIWPVKRFCKLFSLSVFTTGARTLLWRVHTTSFTRTLNWPEHRVFKIDHLAKLEGLFFFSFPVFWCDPSASRGWFQCRWFHCFYLVVPFKEEGYITSASIGLPERSWEMCTRASNVTIIKAIHSTKTSVTVQSWSSPRASPLFYSVSVSFFFPAYKRAVVPKYFEFDKSWATSRFLEFINFIVQSNFSL